MCIATNMTSGPPSSSLHPPGGGTGQAFNLSNQVNDVRDARKTSTVEAPQSAGPQTRRISSVENDGGEISICFEHIRIWSEAIVF